VLSREQIMALKGPFQRFVDVDGDGITYRTLPGVHVKGAYFTRGSGHAKSGKYTEDEVEYQEVVDRLLVKWETAKKMVPKPILTGSGRNKLGILSLGSCDGAVREATDQLGRRGRQFDYLRVRAFPFGAEVQAFLDSHERVFVVEQNRDAQLLGLLKLETTVDPRKLVSIRQYSGLPIDCRCIVDGVAETLKKVVAA
jgi:2-oxoglutarate ferredoxin oxidoreductase subunit alpha